jgi:predicted RNase H-like HicB family nuclease
VHTGESFEDAKEKAQEVLELWLEEMREKGGGNKQLPRGTFLAIVKQSRLSREAFR